MPTISIILYPDRGSCVNIRLLRDVRFMHEDNQSLIQSDESTSKVIAIEMVTAPPICHL